MQSAFVDLGLERDGFLYVSDVVATFEEFDRLETDEDDGTGGNGGATGRKGGLSGPRGRRDRERDRGAEPKIEELLKEGQEIIVQVAKEPIGTKGARLTSHATMPGRFLVFMPTVDHVGVSRKIDSRDERSRLRGIVREFREQHGFTGGGIIPTAAPPRPKGHLLSDLGHLHKGWTESPPKAHTSPPPAGVFPGHSPPAQLVRPLLAEGH